MEGLCNIWVYCPGGRPPPPVRGERFASPLSVVWMSYCPHPPTTTTWRTFYLTQFTAEGGLRRSRVGPGSTPRGSTRRFGLSGMRPGAGGSTRRPHAYSTASENPAAEMIQPLKQNGLFVQRTICFAAPRPIILLSSRGEKKTNEALGEKNNRIICLCNGNLSRPTLKCTAWS